MSCIGLNAGDEAAPPVVPLPTELWIARERFGRSEIFGFELAPQAAGAAKSGNTAFGGNAGTSKHSYATRFGDQLAGVVETQPLLISSARCSEARMESARIVMVGFCQPAVTKLAPSTTKRFLMS